MAAVATETLSFDRHLRHAFASLSGRLENGIRSLDGVIEMLRLRIEAEAQFASALNKIIHNERLISSLNESESLRKDGLDAIQADMRNEHTQRLEFLNSLNEDVYQPCVSMRELYAQKNRFFANGTKANIKALRQHQNQFYKIKSKYEKVCKDASSARTALLNAKLDNRISSAQILKLGSKVNSTLKTQQNWREKYDQQQLIWNRQQIKFDDEMTSILQGMQSNEFNRMKTTKDSLNKWAVFITNLCANRNYDVKNLAESMSLINIDNDLQTFIHETLTDHPLKNPNAPTPPHHSFHYGKQHQNALSNLNKTSTERNHPTNVDTNARTSRTYHKRDRSNNSISLSSFNPSFNASIRKGSTSYSFSGQQDIFYELSKRQRQQSTPNSIGSFFKQKFKKDRNNINNMTHTHSNGPHSNDYLIREHSNTISSYHGDSEVYPPIIDDEIPSPRSVVNDKNLSPRSECDREIEISLNGNSGNSNGNEIHRKQLRKKVKRILNKPGTKRRRHIQSMKHNTQKTNKAITPNQRRHRTPPPEPVYLHKSRSVPQLITNQNLDTSLFIANHTRYHRHTNNGNLRESPHQTPITPTSPTLTPHSPNSTAITINHSTLQKIQLNAHAPQIIVFKKKKVMPMPMSARAPTPTRPPRIPQSSNDEQLDDGLSTPTLSGASDDDDDDGYNENNHNARVLITLNHQKRDTPVPSPHNHKKGQNIYADNLDFAVQEMSETHPVMNHSTHFYTESEELVDPLD